ncbi:CoA transferase [Mycolicibacterium agri]|uniref:CoA transferase n=1 Tax=Mycolicibacterium agri TaxID=36811 RepID=A0A2A7NFS0_MYCAG|nr:CoA transferase [Mycolicibacterium agri]PEG42699.1 CoA transferase [Mycolicibacterium agri]GFG52681.1 CoA transferase [Mycolicibacterium agri]
MTALQGLRVLDVTQVLAGPFCGQLLADMGADVIKVEPPETGDQSRRALGFSLKGDDTAAFLAVNRNKRSLTLNLKSDAGRDAFYRLVRQSDIVIENFRPGVAKRLGIDYETLSAIHPPIICASISGYGQDGPYATRPAHDLIAQGMAGLMSVTGEPDGPPAKVGISIADLSAGLFCAYGIVCAVVARHRTGRGQYVDTSIFEAPIALAVFESTELWGLGRIPRPLGSTNRTAAPNQALRARDGYINVCAANERLWQRLCEALGRDDLPKDPRFATNMDRMAHQGELAEELERTLVERDVADWVDHLLAVGVPVGPILNYEQVFSDPHTLARKMVVEMEHPVEGTLKGLGIPVKLSDTPGSVRSAAPLLGEHTTEILCSLGYSDEEISRMRRDGAA